MRLERHRLVGGIAVITIVAAATVAGLAAADPGGPPAFNHAGTFSVPQNLGGDPIATPTSAEIVDATPDGDTLVYTDSPLGRIGFIDISNAAEPGPDGTLAVGGEPTSVAVIGNRALVGVNTSESYTDPSGELVVVDLTTRAIEERLELAGQPDSIDVSPDGAYAAVVIENERDEDLDDGLIPQLPAGLLQVVDLGAAEPKDWAITDVALTGLADVAPTDPEPEFVDINDDNEAVVSLQENNHLVIVDLEDASVIDDFSAGTAKLEDVDATEEKDGPQGNGVIALKEDIERRREPDAVAWIDANTFATANEGDYEDENGDVGGSRGFTIFEQDGDVLFESGEAFEHEIVRAGHYPEGRSANKGNEPEGLEVGVFGDRTFLFVGSERANVVGVYDVSDPSEPELHQLLPTGMGPEGIKALPGEGLLAVSAEVDGKDEDPGDQFDVRSLVTLYSLENEPASYPYLASADESGLPIPWVAISGLAGDPADADTLWAVSDSFLAQAYAYRINVASGSGVIGERIAIGGVEVENLEGDFDLEGIAARPGGGFWLASEGRINDDPAKSRPNLLIQAAADGSVVKAIELPASLVGNATSSGLEGVAVVGSGNQETVYVAVQREWKDDAKGFVKIGRYEVKQDRWKFTLYPLDPVESPNGGWVGLSEITTLPSGKLAIVERDNQLGLDARIKRVYEIDPQTIAWKEHGKELKVLAKSLRADLLDELDAASISVPDKLEGFGVTADGRVFVATDNDGVDENYGETLFLELAG